MSRQPESAFEALVPDEEPTDREEYEPAPEFDPNPLIPQADALDQMHEALLGLEDEHPDSVD